MTLFSSGLSVILSKLKQLLPLFMWSFGALSFFMQYACRTAPSVILDELTVYFAASPIMIGYLGAAFLYPYVVMQLFVGRLVDHAKPHRVLILTVAVFFIANQIFSESIHIYEAIAARLIMGAAGAFTFVVTMKLAMLWFENRYLGILAGATQVSGMLGVVFGNSLVDYMLVGQSWQPVIKILSMLMCGLLLMMIILMRDKEHKRNQLVEPTSLISGLSRVLSHRQSWFNALFCGLIYLPTAAFGEYWGIQYLTHTNVLMDKHQAVLAVNMIFIGWAVGGLAIGAWSDYMKLRRPLMLVTPILCVILLVPVLYWHTMPPLLVYSALCLYGVFNSGLVLGYAVSGEIHSQDVSGVSIAFCNMLSILLGSIALPMVGWLLSIWASQSILHGYEVAASLFPCALILASLMACGVRETHCQQA